MAIPLDSEVLPLSEPDIVTNENLELVQKLFDNSEVIKYVVLYGFGALVMLITLILVVIFFLSFKR